MSKNVKYISSKHYGTPQITCHWGKTIEVLRKSLSEGFNERNDVNNIEILNARHIKISFDTAHNFIDNQTIIIAGTIFGHLNDEFRVVSYDELTITCEVYTEFTESQLIIDITTYEGITVKVAPLGFIEKYRDGNRSAFTTDEEEAFFYMDDNEPTQWAGAMASNYFPLMCPLVFMTDSMNNIDDEGRYIVPYDVTNPTRHRTKDWLSGTYKKTGLWNWVTYGHYSHTNGTLEAARNNISHWHIIGNGRLFYFICDIYRTTDMHPKIFYFGKPNNDVKQTDLKYIMNNTNHSGNWHDYTSTPNSPYGRIDGAGSKYAFENTELPSSRANYSNMNYQPFGVLKINNKSITIGFNPIIHNKINSPSGSLFNNSNIMYPDKNTMKLYLSDYHINCSEGYIGRLSGTKYVYNADPLIHSHSKIFKYNQNGKNKKYFCINGTFPNDSDSSTSSIGSNFNSAYINKVIFISLNSEDWYNYD